MIGNNQQLNRRRAVMLAVQTALLGEVTPNLRAVTVSWHSSSVRARLLYDGHVEGSETECASDIEAELMAVFPEENVSVFAEQLDYPKDLNERHLQAWAYMRKE